MKSVTNVGKSCFKFCKKNPVMTTVVSLLVVVVIVVAVYCEEIRAYRKDNTPKPNSNPNTLPQDVQLVQESERNAQVQLEEGFNSDAQSEADLIPVEGKQTVALFHAEWCGYCKKFMPHFESAMSEINGNSKLNLVKVDHDKNDGLSEKYEVKGFPTIVLIKPDGSSEHVDCPRDATFTECVKNL